MLSLSLLIAPAYAMEDLKKDQKGASAKSSVITKIKKYLKLRPCLLQIASLFADDDEEGSEDDAEDRIAATQDQETVRKALNIIIDHLVLSNLELVVDKGKQPEKASKFIDIKKFKTLLKTLVDDYFNPQVTIDQKRKLAYARMLKDALKMGALKEALKASDYCDLENLVNDLIDYYDGKPISRPIEEIVKIEKIFELIGFDIQKYGNIKNIKTLINMILQKQPLGQRSIVDCFNLQTIIGLLDAEAEEADVMQEYEECVGSIISMGIDLARNQKLAFAKIRAMLALYDLPQRLTQSDWLDIMIRRADKLARQEETDADDKAKVGTGSIINDNNKK